MNANETPTMTVIIPAYEPTEDFLSYARALIEHSHVSLLVVDDGSGERFRSTFDSIAMLPRTTVLSYAQNKGKGHALKVAFAHAHSHCTKNSLFVTADCDGQHDIADIFRVGKATQAHPHTLVLGARDFSHPTVPLRSQYGNISTRRILSLLYGLHLMDSQTGLRGFDSSLLPFLLGVRGERFAYETHMLIAAKQQGIALLELPIATIYQQDENGKNQTPSHFKTIRDSLAVMGAVLWGIRWYWVVTLLSGAVDIGAFILLARMAWMGHSPRLHLLYATWIARLLSSAVNYIGHRRLVFRHTSAMSILRYYLVWLGQLVLSSRFVFWMSTLVPTPSILYVSKGIFDVVVAGLAFVVLRRWVFAQPKTSPQHFFGHLAKFSRKIVRIFSPKYHSTIKTPSIPCVFVGRHLNLHGPMTVAKTLPFDLHMMVLGCFFSQKDCFRQYAEYTFTKKQGRVGIRKYIGKICAFFASLFVPHLVRSMQSVPVYRGGGAGVCATFREAMGYLSKGESVAVFPEIAYSEKGRSSCDMYTGFLALERFYFRRFKKHIHFVVLSVDDKAKRLSAVADIAFSGQIPFSDELPLIASKIKSALELNA